MRVNLVVCHVAIAIAQGGQEGKIKDEGGLLSCEGHIAELTEKHCANKAPLLM